jgi:hypothetical protein
MDRIVKAKTPADLEKVQRALDKIIDASIRDYAKGALAEEGDSERPFWLAHVQSLIQHRMEQLRTNSDAAPRAGASDS